MSKRTLTAITAILLLTSGTAVSAEAVTDAPAASSLAGELMAIVLPLAFIIAGLVVVLRLVRKRYGLTGPDAPLSILQILPLGPRERLVLVKSRSGRVFTVGVAAQTVTFITDLEAEDVASPGEPEGGAG
ncbi:FliO/MopB family protein [Luteimonas arsenica]|uniref:FliO/MopB family protein n=1 Tax=Luteimonas arsenica TaxID=1586242 RepID=UPI0010545933|nr:flagellar biosynthetic protein FliO [Luteimonas arsenica]